MIGILPSLVPDKARPLAMRPYLVPTIYMTCLAGSLLPPSRARSISVATVLAYILIQIPKYTSGDVGTDYLMPIQAVLAVIHWIDFFVIHSPDEYCRIKDNGANPTSLWEKLKWNWDLMISMRGIGWNWKVKNVPKSDTETSRCMETDIVRTELCKAALWYLLFDVCWTAIPRSPYVSTNPPDLFEDSVINQVLYSWVTACNSAWAGLMQYSVLSAITVLCGLYTPQEWPPLMGRLREASTVRDMWGKFWHQMLRRTVNIPFTQIKQFVPIRRGTYLSRYTQLGLAFVVSGLIHHIGALNLPSSSREGNFKQLAFFLMQPGAIVVEDLAVHLGKKVGVKSSWTTKALRRVWIFAWFTFSLRYMAAFQYSAGILSKPVMPSLTRAILDMITQVPGKQSTQEL